MVLPDKVVQVGLVEILIAINGIESGCQPEESNASPKSKADTAPREKSIFRHDRFVRASTPCYEVAIAINEEIEDETEDNWVDLEVDR